MEAWLGCIAAIAGVIIGWGLNQTTKIITDRCKANRELKAAAFICIDRLLKIQNAASRSDDQQKEREVYLLGSDLSGFRDAIATHPRMRKHHWPIYRRMTTLVLQHDLKDLDRLIDDLETLCGVKK